MYKGYHFSPHKEDLSLKTDDIVGATTKPKFAKKYDHYRERLYHQGYPYDNIPTNYQDYPTTLVNDQPKQNSAQSSHYDNNYYRAHSLGKDGAALAQHGGQPVWMSIQHGQRAPERTPGKKHFPEKIAEMSEIRREQFDYPRNLSVQDIPGTSPGTLVSKVVKNHDIAEKMRLSHKVQADTLDLFKNQFQKPKDPLEDPFWKEHQYHQQQLLEQQKQEREIQEQQKHLASTRTQPNQNHSDGLEKSEQAPENAHTADKNVVEPQQITGNANKTPERANSQQSQAHHDDILEKYKHEIQAEKNSAHDNNYEHFYQWQSPATNSKKPLANLPERASQENYKPADQSEKLNNVPTQDTNQSPNTSELIRRERMLLQQYQDMKKLYSYNIISNVAQLKYAPSGSRFNASIKNSYSFENPEINTQIQGLHPQEKPSNNIIPQSHTADPGSYKPNYNVNNNIFSTNAGQALSQSSIQGQHRVSQSGALSSRPYDAEKYFAGKASTYVDSPGPNLQPSGSQSDMTYGMRGLKNVSGRLY